MRHKSKSRAIYLERAHYYFEENRLENTESIADLAQKALSNSDHAAKNLNLSARDLWYKINGKREREHTTAVFLKKAKVKGAAPVLAVYVDSSVFVTEWYVNREMYLGRLAMADFAVSGIEFLLSKEEFIKEKQQELDKDRMYAPNKSLSEDDLPPLKEKDAKWIEEQISILDPSLQDKARCAMSLLIRRRELGDAQDLK